jgi:hypothetical protein
MENGVDVLFVEASSELAFSRDSVIAFVLIFSVLAFVLLFISHTYLPGTS